MRGYNLTLSGYIFTRSYYLSQLELECTMAVTATPELQGEEQYTYEISPEDQKLIVDAFADYQIEGADFQRKKNSTEVTVYGGTVPSLE